MKFPELMTKVLKPEVIQALPKCILTLDPGETTGYSVWKPNSKFTWSEAPLYEANQVKTKTIRQAIARETSKEQSLYSLFAGFAPDLVVFEDYRVYGWKTEEHAWSSVHTIQLIGYIKSECITRGIPFVIQSAQVAKQFCTDEKLDTWGYYKPGLRHGRDAIRHGAYYILFGSQKEYDSEGYVKAK